MTRDWRRARWMGSRGGGQGDRGRSDQADAYYLKTQGLASLITTTADGKLVAPPGFVDACNKYLQLGLLASCRGHQGAPRGTE